MKNYKNSKKYKDFLKFYTQNGWVIIKNFLDKKQVKKIKKVILDNLKRRHKKFTGRYINYHGGVKKFSRITSFHQLESIKKIKFLSDSGKFSELAKFFLYNKKPQLRASELFIKRKNFGFPTSIHQDDYYWNVKGSKGLTLWVALSKSNKNNGSVFYFDKSHKRGIFKHSPTQVPGSSQKIQSNKLLKKFNKSSPNLNPGDVLIHHSLTVHGSYKSFSNKKRIGWTFAFKQKSAPYDQKRTRKFEKRLFKQIKSRDKNYILQEGPRN